MSANSLGSEYTFHKITPFENKEVASKWLADKSLNLNSTPILLPFYEENKRVEFLNPGDKEDRLRIIGSGIIKEKNKNLFKKFKYSLRENLMGKKSIAHMNKQKESIAIAKNDFLIVYKKDERNTSVTAKIHKLICETLEQLEKDIILSQTNDGAKITMSSLVEDLNKLGRDLNITAGMCYFINKDEKGNDAVFRSIFKPGTADKRILAFFDKEENATVNNEKMATPYQIQNNKTVETHRIAFINEFLAGLVVLGIAAFAVAIGITLCMLIIPFPINLIAAATTTAILLPNIPLIYKKALKNNKNTIAFAKTFIATPLKEINNLTVAQLPKAIDQFKENILSDDEVDSPATPSKNVSAVFVKSYFPNNRFINRLDSINEDENEDEVDSASLDTPQESSIGIRHGYVSRG